jgi:hypothetical protein
LSLANSGWRLRPSQGQEKTRVQREKQKTKREKKIVGPLSQFLAWLNFQQSNENFAGKNENNYQKITSPLKCQIACT